MNENVKKMIEEKKEEILERAMEMYRSSLSDHNEHMLCLSSDGYLYGHEGSGTPIGVYNGDDICVFQCQRSIDDCDFTDGVKYLLDPDQFELLEEAKSWVESELDFDEIEAWQELFPDRFELDSDEESMVDAALEGNEHVNELQIWQELFPEKFDLNDVDQKKMDLAVEINNSHMDEEDLIEKMFPDEWEEMNERVDEDIDNKRAELEEELEGQLGDEIAEFLLSNGLIDENTTTNDEIASEEDLTNNQEQIISRIKNGERVCTWSVQNEEGDDDIFNGTLEECKDYIRKYGRGDLVGVALIQLDENLGFDYCHDSIDIDDLDLDISENDNACSDEVEGKTSISEIKQMVAAHRSEHPENRNIENAIHSR